MLVPFLMGGYAVEAATVTVKYLHLREVTSYR